MLFITAPYSAQSVSVSEWHTARLIYSILLLHQDNQPEHSTPPISAYERERERSVCQPIVLSLSLSVCLSVCLFIYRSIYLSFILSICSMSICLFTSYLSVYFSIGLPFYISNNQPVYILICLSLSVCLSVCLLLSHHPSPSLSAFLSEIFDLKRFINNAQDYRYSFYLVLMHYTYLSVYRCTIRFQCFLRIELWEETDR